MYTTCLPPALEQVLSDRHEGDTLLMEIADEKLLKLFFVEVIMSNLLSKKNTLVVIPDSMSVDIPAQILSNYNLGHLAVELDYQGAVVNCGTKVKTLITSQEIPLLRQEYQHVLLKKKDLENKVHDTLVSINKASVKRPAFKKMLLSIKMRPRKSISESLIEEITSIHISSKAIDAIKQLQRTYEPRFLYMDSCVPLGEAHLEDDEALFLARKDMSDLSQKAASALQSLEKELWLKKRVIAYEVEEELAAWSSVKEELETALLDYDIDGQPSSFSEKGLAIIEKFKGYNYLRLSVDITPEVGWGQVPDLLTTVQAIMDIAEGNIDLYFEEYTKKLSPFNSGHQQLDQAIHTASDILKEAHHCKYLNLQCQRQFLQVGALLTDFRSVATQLNLAKEALHDEQYVLHHKLARDLNLSKSLLTGLHQMSDEDWAGIIEFYGQRSHLMAMYTGHMSKLTQRYVELDQTQDLIRHMTHKEIHNRWHRLQRELLVNLKNDHWDLYKQICDNATEETADILISEKLNDLLPKMFPVQVMSMSNKRRNPQVTTGFSQIIYLDHKHIEFEDLSSIDFSSSEVILASSYTLHNPEIINTSHILSHYISDSYDIGSSVLSELDSSERYKAALGIANNVSNLSRVLNIYKKEDKIIMTSVDPYFNDRIVKLLDLDTQHVLYQATKDPAHVIETLIHHDDVHFVIENGLVNDQTGKYPAWQQHVKQQMRDAGILIHSIHTADLYQNMTACLAALKSEIGVTTRDHITVKGEQQVLTFAGE